jgi:hypothetical protein
MLPVILPVCAMIPPYLSAGFLPFLFGAVPATAIVSSVVHVAPVFLVAIAADLLVSVPFQTWG